MIPKSEILEISTRSNVNAHVIDKDYVLGWILAGINNHHEVGKAWFFKGGTCLKKCYFETYRFSEDLDFTLSDHEHINADFLEQTFKNISGWIYEKTGIEIPIDRMVFDIYKNPRGVMSCRGKLFYRGPASPNAPKQMPRIKLDLSVDEILVEEAVINRVSHNYSDEPESGIHIACYSYKEIFAEKIRALGERTRPRDLYDVINLYRRPESENIAFEIKKILQDKCKFKAIHLPTCDTLIPHKEECASGWDQQLKHQLQALPPFDGFWRELPSFFNWLYNAIEKQPSHLRNILKEQQLIEEPIPLTDWRGQNVSPQQLSILDKIKFAGSNHLCLEINYRREDGFQRSYTIEPYSINKTLMGHFLLSALKHKSKEIRAFRIDRISNIEITDKTFTPSYQVDLIPLNLNLSKEPHLPSYKKYTLLPPSKRKIARKHVSTFPGSTEPKYIYQCPTCGKKFIRKKLSGKNSSHKNKNGFLCSGRTLIHIDTKY